MIYSKQSTCADMATAAAFTQHIFGQSNPSGLLLESGRLPAGWVQEYCRLLESVASDWALAPAWPRRMVGALHYAFTHLRLRNVVWQHSSDRRDENTELEYHGSKRPRDCYLHGRFRCGRISTKWWTADRQNDCGVFLKGLKGQQNFLISA